jgi:hypothetical protein
MCASMLIKCMHPYACTVITGAKLQAQYFAATVLVRWHLASEFYDGSNDE